jgi:integrating conjugative element membrane protein (TIGR03747 family)
VASKDSTIDDKPLVKQWLWPLRLTFWIGVIGVCLWAYCILASTWWARRAAPEAPVQAQIGRLAQDMDDLALLAPKLFSPLELARSIGDGMHDTLVKSLTGVARAFMNPPTHQTRSHFGPKSAVKTSDDPGGDYVAQAARDAGGDWDNVVVGTYVFAVRTAYFIAGLPLIALGLALGLVDGLVGRAQRKASAGRESSGLYHRAKLGISFALITAYLVCLGLPSLPQPAHLWAPLALICGGLVRLQACFYKKYL